MPVLGGISGSNKAIWNMALFYALILHNQNKWPVTRIDIGV